MTETYFTTSWDDGHPADLRVAEMLSRYRLAGTFYIPRTIDSGVMSEPQMRQIAEQGFEIGAHTLTHAFLPSVDAVTAKSEIDGSKQWVADVTGSECRMFCPPGGKFDARHLRNVRDAGFLGVRTVELVSLGFPRRREVHGGGMVMEMPTTIQAFPHAVGAYARNIAKRAAARNLWVYLVHGHARDWSMLARRLIERAAGAGGVFHLWGHSWELVEQRQWERLDEVFRVMAEHARHARHWSNGRICEHFREGALARRPQRAA
ncbi:MAG: polysaccharide deacetylase family protein [Tepidisphaeraceae bacterium]